MRVSISTGVYGKSFLTKAWEGRRDLLDYEKRGFAQFFYLTICGHVESVLASIVTTRLTFISTIVPWELLPHLRYNKDNVEIDYPLDPIVQSVKHISRGLAAEVESASLSKLIELFGRVFPEKMREVIGRDLHDDIEALASLRNLFAHGRNIFMKFETKDFSSFKGILDGNPLKKPAESLSRAGILKKDFAIDGTNHDVFQAVFYSDDAMLHFYKIVQDVEDRLASFTKFAPEKDFLIQDKLPALDR